MSASASTAFRNLELTSEQADAMGLGGEDFDYAVTERALDADAGTWTTVTKPRSLPECWRVLVRCSAFSSTR